MARSPNGVVQQFRAWNRAPSMSDDSRFERGRRAYCQPAVSHLAPLHHTGCWSSAIGSGASS